jgi:hypothetical protein
MAGRGATSDWSVPRRWRCHAPSGMSSRGKRWMRGPRHEGKAPANRRGVLACSSARCTRPLYTVRDAVAMRAICWAGGIKIGFRSCRNPDVFFGHPHPNVWLASVEAVRFVSGFCACQHALMPLQEAFECPLVGGASQLVVGSHIASILPVKQCRDIAQG